MFRKKLYGRIEELQPDLDNWLTDCNNHRTHEGKMCCGQTHTTNPWKKKSSLELNLTITNIKPVAV
jgi:hypothetical protein